MSYRKKGTVYGIGVGPGDPELMTLKACRLIRENEVIAVPGKKAQESTAYRIALQAVPELAEKELVEIDMPIDPTVYSSFSYIRHILEDEGYTVELVSGITSFCAAAARLGVSLAEWNESLHIMPVLHNGGKIPFSSAGNYALMKPAGKISEVKKMLSGSGFEIFAAENCGMDNEKLYRSAEEIPDDAGYFTLIIAKENAEKDERR